MPCPAPGEEQPQTAGHAGETPSSSSEKALGVLVDTKVTVSQHRNRLLRGAVLEIPKTQPEVALGNLLWLSRLSAESLPAPSHFLNLRQAFEEDKSLPNSSIPSKSLNSFQTPSKSLPNSSIPSKFFNYAENWIQVGHPAPAVLAGTPAPLQHNAKASKTICLLLEPKSFQIREGNIQPSSTHVL